MLPSWMTLSGDVLYWVDGGAIKKMNTDGGVPSEIYQDARVGWNGLASDAASLYFGGTDGALHRLSLDGSQDLALAEVGGHSGSFGVPHTARTPGD